MTGEKIPGHIWFLRCIFLFFFPVIFKFSNTLLISFAVVILFFLRRNIALVHTAHVSWTDKAIIFVMFLELASIFIFIFMQFWFIQELIRGFWIHIHGKFIAFKFKFTIVSWNYYSYSQQTHGMWNSYSWNSCIFHQNWYSWIWAVWLWISMSFMNSTHIYYIGHQSIIILIPNFLQNVNAHNSLVRARRQLLRSFLELGIYWTQKMLNNQSRVFLILTFLPNLKCSQQLNKSS